MFCYEKSIQTWYQIQNIKTVTGNKNMKFRNSLKKGKNQNNYMSSIIWDKLICGVHMIFVPKVASNTSIDNIYG